ncbi:UNVERIFIED_CONTAM: hypothetical protein Sradi_7251000 [Sesamum radiatum]|uniref:Uncharacterized protein n=1 Tax=Sesamum radiatum TaxID=300843 RepID=A0AAW2ILF1_SESRA
MCLWNGQWIGEGAKDLPTVDVPSSSAAGVAEVGGFFDAFRTSEASGVSGLTIFLRSRPSPTVVEQTL